MPLRRPALLVALLAASSPLAAQQPNVLLVIADDLGTDSLGLYNATPGVPLPPTPTLDALRAGGVLFRNAYAHPTCSPTRAAILTGRHPYRTGVTTAVTVDDGQLQASEFTLPRAFAANPDLGYALAQFGKWHLSMGPAAANDPANLAGWPHYAGNLGGALSAGNGGTGTYFAWTKTVNGVTGTTNGTTTYATTDLVNDAAAWITARGNAPWFAWLAFNAPHTPFHKPPADLHTYDTTVANWTTLAINTNQRTHYHAAIQALDTELGRLLAGLAPEVRANTWIVFVGDNGTPGQVVQSPYTNGHAKGSLYEGGIRVPMLVSGPGIVGAGREVADEVHAVDLYATILELAGIDVAATQPATKPLDSRSIVPLLRGEAESGRFGLGETSGSSLAASASGRTVRDGDWKLIVFADGTRRLHRVSTDPDEQVNLLASTLTTEAQAAHDALAALLDGLVVTANPLGAPVETSWQTIDGAEYARIYRTQDRALAGLADTTWAPSGSVRNGTQATPAYAGVASVRVSANWVYVKGSALPHYTMGPWYFDAAKTQLFVNYPNQWDLLARIPRQPAPAATRSNTDFGPIAVWVNTAIIHNQLDAFYWNGSADVDTGATGTEWWTRNAWFAEGPTFDPAGAHQPFTGESHHHISPSALRHELGDHVDYDPTTHAYRESTGAPDHSPILGWSFDGYPIYGPYGYADADDPASGVRRMVSGYVPRDGSFGTTNLVAAGRTTLPAWALRAGHGQSAVNDAATGPAVSASFPLGWYLQDFEYLGDLGRVQGQDFDLDDSNGRWCVTPEFPEGTYAYFVALDASFQPAFPYIIGRQYFGVKQGGNWAAASTIGFDAIEEPHVTTYLGGAQAETRVTAVEPRGGELVLRWTSVEGGRYVVEGSADLLAWNVVPATTVDATTASTEAGVTAAGASRSFHRVRLESVAAHDVIDTP